MIDIELSLIKNQKIVIILLPIMEKCHLWLGKSGIESDKECQAIKVSSILLKINMKLPTWRKNI